jgi:hypothetical protein
MSLARKHKQYTYSRKVATEAALTTLQYQWVLYLETQVGGRLCRHGWKFLVLLVQDFLFATAILCTELAEEVSLAGPSSNTNGAPASVSSSHTEGNNGMRDRVFHALSSAYIVWLQSNDSETSQEVKLVVAALKHLLSKAQEAGFGQAKMVAPTPPATVRNANTNANTGGSGSTPSEQRGPGNCLGVEEPVTAGIYWGLGHFPI